MKVHARTRVLIRYGILLFLASRTYASAERSFRLGSLHACECHTENRRNKGRFFSFNISVVNTTDDSRQYYRFLYNNCVTIFGRIFK